MAANMFEPSNSALVMYLTTLSAIILLGITGNVVTIIVVTRPPHRLRSLTPFLVNLAVADILVCLLGYAIAAGSQIMAFAQGQRLSLGDSPSCSWIAFVNAFAGIACIATLTTMTFLTYDGITHSSVASHRRMHAHSVAFVLVAIWSYALVLAAPPAFGWNRFVPVQSKVSCHPNWASQEISDVAYVIFLVTFGFFLPLAEILWCSFGILRCVVVSQEEVLDH